MCPFPEHQRFRVIRMSQGVVIDIMTYNSYSLQYYSSWKGKIGFTRTGSCFWGQRQFTPGVIV